MKRSLPDSAILPEHPDFERLTALSTEITARAYGPLELERTFPQMLRDCIDAVIMTAKTGRRSYEELEKTEKTYIGTRVEIELRALLGLRKGRLDTEILGQDVDIKNTMGSNWMIPTEAVDQPCILVAADEARALCYLGLIVARPAYLTVGKNKDAKRSISAEGFRHILWLLKEQPYPANFWRSVPADAVAAIFMGQSGNARMAELFRQMQGRAVPRDVIEAVAKQKDFTRRIRKDNGRGTRDILEREGIVLMEGRTDAQLIKAFDLPECGQSSFISFRPRTVSELNMARQAGFDALPDLANI